MKNKEEILKKAKELFPQSKPRHYLTEGQRMGFEKGALMMLDQLDCDPVLWLQKNKKFISIRSIEKALNMPDSTLIKAINGAQKLPEKWRQPLNDFIKSLRS
jgi:hypothetical protein